MRVAGRVAADTLSLLDAYIKPGITTNEINRRVDNFIRSNGCTPLFLNYEGYKHSICASINEEIVHCEPSEKVLKDGDIVTIDLGALYEGYCADTAKTYLVGNVSEEAKKFVQASYDACRLGVTKCVNGNYVSDISNAVYDFMTKNGYGIVKEFVGHGIGKKMHEDPKIPSIQMTTKGPQLVKNMVVCIEPITKIDKNANLETIGRWYSKTSNNTLAAQFEHMVLITDNEPEILTLRYDEIK